MAPCAVGHAEPFRGPPTRCAPGRLVSFQEAIFIALLSFEARDGSRPSWTALASLTHSSLASGEASAGRPVRCPPPPLAHKKRTGWVRHHGPPPTSNMLASTTSLTHTTDPF